MDNLLLIVILIVTVGATGWFYWQTQKTEQRITQTAAQLAEQAGLLGEMVDEVFAASQNLYNEMDRWQTMIDREENRELEQDTLRDTLQDTLSTSAPAQSTQTNYPTGASHALPTQALDPIEVLPVDVPAPRAATNGNAQTNSITKLDYAPHLEALKLAADGASFVDIARATGIGTEELRLLLSFQDAVNNPARQ